MSAMPSLKGIDSRELPKATQCAFTSSLSFESPKDALEALENKQHKIMRVPHVFVFPATPDQPPRFSFLVKLES
jgi:hypothetical protein